MSEKSFVPSRSARRRRSSLVAGFFLGAMLFGAVATPKSAMAEECEVTIKINNGEKITTAAVRDEAVKKLEEVKKQQSTDCLKEGVQKLIDQLKRMKF